jgi:hypothetical protein
MKRFNEQLERGRWTSGAWASDHGNDFGAFQIMGPCGQSLKIIISPGDADEGVPWEHASVSCRNRCPNWIEMSFVKDLVWDAEETVMQLHPPKSQWINNHPYCLHLWRPLNVEIPLPPAIAVGVPGVEIEP